MRAPREHAQIEPDHLAPARLVHAVGGDESLGAHVAAGADLELLGIEPQIGKLAFQRTSPEDLDLLVELAEAQATKPVVVMSCEGACLEARWLAVPSICSASL